MNTLTRLCVTFACSLLAPTLHAADLPAGQIDGKISDILGKPIVDAALTLKPRQGKTLFNTRSDAQGNFHFTHLPAGMYALIANKAGFVTGTDIVILDATQGKISNITLSSKNALAININASGTNRPRNGVNKDTGTNTYHISSAAIDQMPLGNNTPFNQVLLQAPGVVQDSFGQLHVRGDHANLQYRINGILLPEAIAGFGQMFDSRFIDSMNLLTGTLSAEYGYQTAGVVDIHTKTGTLEQGGDINIMGGQQNTGEVSTQLQGHKGNFSYYLDASSLSNNLGIENPMPTVNAIHDGSTQNNGFGYFSWTISDTMRLTAMFGANDSSFQIPDLTGQTPLYQLNGVSNYPSQNINEQQQETTRYGLLALQGTLGDRTDYQVSVFTRYTRVLFSPDNIGDLIYTGEASRVLRSGLENGVQVDMTYHLNMTHTLHYGLYSSHEQMNNDVNMTQFPADSAGNQTSTTPFTLNSTNAMSYNLYGIYADDVWHLAPAWTLDYGLRYDIVEAYTNGDQLSPRASLVWQLSPQTTLHIGYAHYFTPPPDELVSGETVISAQNTTNAQPGGTLNSPVKSQSSDDFDAGINQRVTPNLNLGLDTYYKYVTNLLDEGQFGSALLFTPFNYAEGKIYGTEFTANYHLNSFSSYFNLARSTAMGKDIISAQYNFSPTELSYIANNWVHLDHDQTWTASSGMTYDWLATTYSADLIYGSGLRSGFANTSHLAPYTQLNIAAARSIQFQEWGKFDYRLSVLNLLDSSYEIRNGTGIGVGAPQYGPRRAVFLSINKSF